VLKFAYVLPHFIDRTRLVMNEIKQQKNEFVLEFPSGSNKWEFPRRFTNTHIAVLKFDSSRVLYSG
jgi:hypothetical protein